MKLTLKLDMSNAAFDDGADGRMEAEYRMAWKACCPSLGLLRSPTASVDWTGTR